MFETQGNTNSSQTIQESASTFFFFFFDVQYYVNKLTLEFSRRSCDLTLQIRLNHQAFWNHHYPVSCEKPLFLSPAGISSLRGE